jgi:TonB family protein
MSRLLLASCILFSVAFTSHGQAVTGITSSGQKVTVPSGANPPWRKDVLKWVGPEYPYHDRNMFHEGTGVYRVAIDVKTGTVIQTAIVRSTGYPTLDGAASRSFLGWRFRPATWRTIEVPVTYLVSAKFSQALQRAHALMSADQQQRPTGQVKARGQTGR